MTNDTQRLSAPEPLSSDLRLLLLLAREPGSHTHLALALATGMATSTIENTTTRCEARGWLFVKHGSPYTPYADAEPNTYGVTDIGLSVIPGCLRDLRLGRDFRLDHPLWAETGYGMYGMLLAVRLGPGIHTVTPAEVARLLDRKTDATREQLRRWSSKQQSFGMVEAVEGRYQVLSPGDDITADDLVYGDGWDAWHRHRARLSGRQVEFRKEVKRDFPNWSREKQEKTFPDMIEAKRRSATKLRNYLKGATEGEGAVD